MHFADQLVHSTVLICIVQIDLADHAFSNQFLPSRSIFIFDTNATPSFRGLPPPPDLQSTQIVVLDCTHLVSFPDFSHKNEREVSSVAFRQLFVLVHLTAIANKARIYYDIYVSHDMRQVMKCVQPPLTSAHNKMYCSMQWRF